MLNLRTVVALATLAMVSPFLTLKGRAETLRFAWPDGAAATVKARVEGRRTMRDQNRAWDMTSEFTMRVRRAGERVVVSRNDFSGWKGSFPPSLGGGAERFTDMVPALIVSGDGAFLGIEGHDAARKLMAQSVEQSGGADPAGRAVFENFLTNAALEAMSTDHWSTLVAMWLNVELDPDAAYELNNVASVPQLGGEVKITGTLGFVREVPCASGRGDRRCVQFHAETGADKAQVGKLVQARIKQAGAESPAVTAWDQRFKVDIVLDKATMLPQQLTINRVHAMDLRVGAESGAVSEDITKTYTFAWTLPGDERKK